MPALLRPTLSPQFDPTHPSADPQQVAQNQPFNPVSQPARPLPGLADPAASAQALQSLGQKIEQLESDPHAKASLSPEAAADLESLKRSTEITTAYAQHEQKRPWLLRILFPDKPPKLDK